MKFWIVRICEETLEMFVVERPQRIEDVFVL
jgi:hypothetical protein